MVGAWSHPTTPPRTGDPASDLLRARAALLAPPPGARRLGPAALRAALVDLHDLWLATRSASLGLGPGTALVAIGSLGRRDLAPWSGLDLLLVHDGAGPAADRIADALAAHLAEADLGPGPAVRTVGEAVEASLADLRVALGLLEVRLVAGDPEPAGRLAAAARRAWRAGAADRAADLVDLTRTRWDRAGDVAHRLEPDLRDGRGGLRDVALLDALAVAGTPTPAPGVRAARSTLLDLRTDLHRRAGRARDVLRVDDARELATGDAPFAGRHDVVRAYSGAARTVVHAVETALRVLRPARRGAAPARRVPADGVVERAGEVTLALRARVARDPVLVLRLAAAAARTGLPMAPAALRRLADAAPELREPWPEEARRELLTLLGARDSLVDVVEALDRAGLWGRLLPEWGAVRDLPPADRRHVWTVGRHLLEVTRGASGAAARVPRPDLLLLGALVHGLGEGRGDDPGAVGATLAGHVGRRLGLPAPDVATLAAVVRHQRLLPRTARRDDPEDPATVRRVLDALDDDPVLLEILAVLAEVDAVGTGPGVWTPWLSGLVGDLVARCRAALGASTTVSGP
ncbi:HD domain-containing protein [Actinomycetospora sp. OC33-EN08]|uniref:HD domain-containing protein n=1 Tax=Actinomycetospora aurantiaca TaxID=3129233 RepID=A0ABU8MVH7_9PSEU